jgi:RHS repeat-associated protein
MNVSHRIGAASPLRGRVWPCLGDLAGSAEVTVAGSFDAQDRMLSYGTCQYEYTRNGELTRRTDSASGAVTNYQYDEFGNLRGVDLPDGRVVSYHIDGLNRRVGKSIDGVRQWGLLYANQLEPVAELDGAGNIVASFLYADRPHVPSLMLKGGHTYRILSDHLGSVRLVIDLADGSIAQRLAYDEYGNVIEDTNPGFQPFAYAGGLYDPDTHLTRFGARDYDALAGRWTAKDPIGFGGKQFNLYSYVGNRPLSFFDPSGMDWTDVQEAARAIRSILPEIYSDYELRMGDLGGDVKGLTDHRDGTITINSRDYAGPLDADQRLDLLDTMIHEQLHASDSILHNASSSWEDLLDGTVMEGLFDGHSEIHRAGMLLAELIFDEAENARWCKP